MKWTTETEIEPSTWKVDHNDVIWTIGSCFADAIGERLAQRGFNVRHNPLGTLFNPESMAVALEAVLSRREYAAFEMVECQGLYHCMDYSTIFSRGNARDVADAVNHTIAGLNAGLRNLSTIILTFGSSHIFRYLPTGLVAGNCHKIPPKEFEEEELSLHHITRRWAELLAALKAEVPALRILLTVSPVRHKAYGLHADRLSKSRLLLACDELCRRCGASYFPAYEILTDELRDYRFYAADLVHPSDVAADYIFGRWEQAYCSEDTVRRSAEELKKSRRASHREISDFKHPEQ